MALQVNDVIRFTVTQKLFGERVQNIFYYRMATVEGTSNLRDITEAFISDILNTWRELVTPDLLFENVLAENLTNGLDFHEEPLVFVGLLTGTAAPSATAASVKLNVSTRETRPGGKRVSGIRADQIDDNDFNPNTVDWGVWLMDLQLQISFTDGGTGDTVIAFHYVVGRDPVTGLPDLSRIQPVANASLRSTITTQTTRRPGRGV